MQPDHPTPPTGPGQGFCACRADFPALAPAEDGSTPWARLDGPAGTQVPRPVIDAIARVYATDNANTLGYFAASEATDELMADARAVTAAFLGAGSGREVSFASSMTSLAYRLAHAFGRRLETGDEVVVTRLDHEANRGPWLGLAERGAVVREVAITADGRLDQGDLERQVSERARVVAVTLASNALGSVPDFAAVREIVRRRAPRAWLVADAVHYAAHFPVDVEALGADFLFCSAYKFYGPHVGILWSRPGLLEELEPDRLSTQDRQAPHRIEMGTLDHPGIAGVAAAVRYIASLAGRGERGDERDGADPDDSVALRRRLLAVFEGLAGYERELGRGYLEAARAIPGVRVHGPGYAPTSEPGRRLERRAPTVAITVDGFTADEVARRLAERHRVAVWDGHFYAVAPITDLGLMERGGVLRAGISMYTTREEVERLLAGLEELAAEGLARR